MTTISGATVERVELPVSGEFTISRGQTESVTTLLVALDAEDGTVGVGGATPTAYYGQTPEGTEAALRELCDAVVGLDPHRQQTIEEQLHERAPNEAAARAAVSVAVHDLAARIAEEPLYRRWGLDPEATPRTSYTVSLGSPPEMAERATAIRERGYPVLKVKLGGEGDRERLEAVRQAAPDARIRVDANGAWDVPTAIANCSWLADAGVEFVEQPVAADDLDGLARVADESDVPIAADESCVSASDVPAVADAVDVVVVKLMKCGGLGAARRQVETAHAHGLDVMVGCMVESDASLAAACHLAPLATYADLDGSLLLASDPCSGVDLADGRIRLGEVAAGTGAQWPGL